MSVRISVGITAALAIALSPLPPTAQQAADLPGAQPVSIDLDFATALSWRPVGPFSSGRTTAIAGDASRPGVFYVGAAGGGVWKTSDYGASWRPIFDVPPSGSASTIAMASSRPDVVYVAADAGPTNAADARITLYMTSDGGDTWQAAGPFGWRYLTHIAVDPVDHRRLFAAGQATSDARDRHGVFRSTDGGVTFERVLDTGDVNVVDIVVHADRPSVIFAVGSPSADRSSGRAGLFRSVDGGSTWQRIERGLPAHDPAHLALAIAPQEARALLAVSQSDGMALYRSDDFGESWTAVGTRFSSAVSARVQPHIAVAPSGAIHLAAGGVWTSIDDGNTFTRSANVPAAREDTLIWHHPSMDGVMLVAGRNGAIVTVNDGVTWSSEAALPAADIDHVIVDAAFPYRICAAQASGISCAPHRTDRGGPDAHDWQPLPTWLARVTPDPLDADIIFGGDVTRYDRRTGQSLDVGRAGVPGGMSQPPAALAFSADGRTLYAGTQSVWRTTNSGQVWTEISPDLTTQRMGARSSTRISALAVSPIDGRTIWAGLDDGRVHVSRDAGETWTESPQATDVERGAIRSIEPSRFDTSSAYVVTASYETATSRLLRTRDGGSTWTDIGANIPDAGAVHTVGEDPFRRGLLFAGTDRSVVVSFDDGERWQMLQLNLPATPVRDLVIRDADLIAGTGGRGVWVLEDMSPLRQLTSDIARTSVFLFRPAQAWRIRATGAVTRDEASRAIGDVLLTYLLGEAVSDELTLEVIETATGDVIRRFSSRPEAGSSTPPLPTTAGLHRVRWDLRYAPPEPDRLDRTPGTPVLPGTYQVRLTAGDRPVRQAVSIRMDPRIRTSIVDLTAQRDLGRAIDATRATLRAALADGQPPASAAVVEPLLDDLNQLARVVQQADVRPSARLEAAVEAALARAASTLGNAGK